jgi:hypothetical protein
MPGQEPLAATLAKLGRHVLAIEHKPSAKLVLLLLPEQALVLPAQQEPTADCLVFQLHSLAPRDMPALLLHQLLFQLQLASTRSVELQQQAPQACRAATLATPAPPRVL